MSHDMDEIVLNEIRAVRDQYHRGVGAHEVKMRLLFPHYFGKWTSPQPSENDIGLAILNLLHNKKLELTSRYFLKPKGEQSYE